MNDPQPLPTDAERAEFERRMGGANFKRNAEGNYINEFVQCKWWGWCAHADAVRELGWQAARRTPATVWVEPAPSADGPKKPWLHLHVDCLPHEQSESVDYTSGDVAWRWHGIHDSDVRYVRADLAVEQALAMGRVPLSNDLVADIRRYLTCARDGSMSRNNSEQLAVELLDALDAAERAPSIQQGGQYAD